MIYKILFSFLIFIFFTGCSISNFNSTINKSLDVFDLEVEKEKKIEYIREPVSLELKAFVKKTIRAFTKNDLIQINKELINKEFGFYNLYKYDGNISFTHQNEIYNIIEEETEEICHLISRVEKESKNFVIIEQDIKFDCSPNDDAYYGWNGDGLYLSNKTETHLSEMMIETNKFQHGKYSVDELNKAYFIEKMGYKIVLTPDIVFYVNKIDDKWYITLFDRITTDCSSADLETIN